MAADLAAAAATTEVDYEEQEEATVMKLLRRRLLSKVPRYRNGSGFRVNGGQSVTLTFPGTDSAHNPIWEGSSSGGGGVDVDGGVADPLNCSVYLDELHGKWKCHHCNWTYFVGSSRSGGLGSHPKWRCRHCNSDPSTQSLSVDHGAPRFSSEIKGAESINGAAEKNGFSVNGLRQQSEGVLENGRLSASSLTSLNGSVERRKGVAESDVEMLLEKQDTHDLYCPDCSSCITQRVVLNIRKQNTPNGHVIMEENKHFTTPKGNAVLEENEQYTSNGYAKLEENTSKAPFHPMLDAEPTHPADDPVQYIDISAYNGSNPAAIDGTDGQQDVFRCLSCFRFFIPEARASSRPQLGSQRATAKPRGGGGGEGYGWEILKCVVFGGLIESITSLGVVSSAAGAGAPTLNVLVMGLANVIGGLVIITNNLLDLKQDCSKATTSDNNDVEAEDRYQTTLGKRENFGIHFMAAILSYLVCGLLPTITYGFTFQSKISSNGNKDEKLAAVGSTSLVCIILLAIAKAHTQKQQQQQPKAYAATVLYFFCIWMATSGICYLVGDLIKNLITPV